MPALRCALLIPCCCGAAVLSAADEGPVVVDGPWDFLTEGSVSFSSRLRLETVSQDNPLEDATALILDTTLGYQTASWNGFSGFLEFENVSPLLDEDYNSGPGSHGNGNTDYSVIRDPTNAEINRLWLQYQGFADTTIKLGRQRIIYDNSRHVGNVGWRANEQTFDAATVDNKSVDQLRLQAAVVGNVSNIDGDNINLDPTLFLNGTYTFEGYGKATAYAYLIDFDEDKVAAADLATFGLRFDGSYVFTDAVKALYEVEVASQGDYVDSDDISRIYYHLVGGVGYQAFVAKVGLEHLGSDDGAGGFAFPFGTNHAFNGWADLFLGTPAVGLQDVYVMLGYTWKNLGPGPLAVKALFHSFESDEDDVDLGSELNLEATYKYHKHLSFGAKAAFYRQGDPGTPPDTDKFWLWTTVTF